MVKMINEKLRQRLLAGAYVVSLTAMAGSLTLAPVKQVFADGCQYQGVPCNLTGGQYACTGGINGGNPVAGCGCDINNICTTC